MQNYITLSAESFGEQTFEFGRYKKCDVQIYRKDWTKLSSQGGI